MDKKIKILLIIGLVVLLASALVGGWKYYNRVDVPDQTVGQQSSLYLTTMTHLEDAWSNMAESKEVFSKVAQEIRFGMDLAEDYDAVLTFEAGLPFSQGCENFDDNVVAEVVGRGHGVGVHPDLQAKKKLEISQASAYIKERILALKNLVDVDVVGCSGVVGKTDWYAASREAGCDYIDGVVAFAYLSMPMSARPDGYTDEAILNGLFHYPAPVGDERFYPFWIDSSKDFIPDEDGDILLTSGETMSLAMFAEAGSRNGERPECGSDCPLTMSDAEIAIEEIIDFASHRDTTRIAKFNVYFPADLFVPANKEVLEFFFSETKKLQDQGILHWASQADVYNAMVAGR
jgi:hypothetical protein